MLPPCHTSRSPAMIYGCDLIQVPDEGGWISERTRDIRAGVGSVAGAFRELVCRDCMASYLRLRSIALDASVKDRGEADGSPFCKMSAQDSSAE